MDIKLLNHQYEVLSDTTTKIIGLVGGYGNGKTYTACRKAIQLSFLNEGFTGIVTEPTFPMLRDIFIPEMKQALEEWGVEYKFNTSNSIFHLNINGNETKILCMSMENVSRLVGVNAAWIICDEFDTTKAELAYTAYNKLLGRLRSGNVRQFIIFTTPEGFKATYRIFVEESDKGNKRLIKAKTTDNKYLPQDFIDALMEQYPEQLLKAYMEGEFVNLNSGTIFYGFKRDLHSSNEIETPTEALHISQDFNIGGCVSIVYIKRDGKLIAVDEYESFDTYGIVANTKDKYPDRVITFYPDASGQNRKTSASDTDLDIIRKAGYKIVVDASNPSVRDRINITNNSFEKGLVSVNINRCKKYANALEQHAYKNGEPEKISGAGTIDDYTDAGTYIIVKMFPYKTYTKLTGNIYNR